MAKLILVGICTYKRNELLKRALEYISQLKKPDGCDLAIVISDNNPDRLAYLVFEQEKNYPINLYYTHVKEQGIANARNGVLEKALELNADYVAFIDDDEYPEATWLEDQRLLLNQ